MLWAFQSTAQRLPWEIRGALRHRHHGTPKPGAVAGPPDLPGRAACPAQSKRKPTWQLLISNSCLQKPNQQNPKSFTTTCKATCGGCCLGPGSHFGAASRAVVTAPTRQSCFGSKLNLSISILLLNQPERPVRTVTESRRQQETHGCTGEEPKAQVPSPSLRKHPPSPSTLCPTCFCTCRSAPALGPFLPFPPPHISIQHFPHPLLPSSTNTSLSTTLPKVLPHQPLCGVFFLQSNIEMIFIKFAL